MLDLKDIFKQFIEQCQKDVQEGLHDKNGTLKPMVTTEITDTSCTLYVPYWFSVFQDGRKPGTFPPFSKILSYVNSINLISKCPDFHPNLQLAERIYSLAYAICVTMEKEGSALWRVLHGGYNGRGYEPKRVEFDKIITKDRVDSFVQLVANKYQAQVSSDILKNVPKNMIR